MQSLQNETNSALAAGPIAIHALATHLPPSKPHKNLLGSVVRSAYNHLYQPAGNFSRPTIVRRGVTNLPSALYDVPTAEDQERTADLASLAAGKLSAAMPEAKAAVAAIFHHQCTLDQQISGSACLRIQDDHFAQAELSMTIAQLGTAGIPTVFQLASLSLKHGRLTCISACDKWIAPFVRSVPGVLSYADASAACLAGPLEPTSEPIAIVDDIATSCVPLPGDVWSLSADVQRRYLLEHARKVIGMLLRRHPTLRREELVSIGDGYRDDLAAELSASLSIPSEPNVLPDVHLSSASPLFAMSKAIALAGERQRPQRALIWTLSQSGHAAAMLVRTGVGAVDVGGVWLARGRLAA